MEVWVPAVSVLVGGIATYIVTTRAENKRQDFQRRQDAKRQRFEWARERAAEAKAVIGIARVYRDGLDRLTAAVRALLEATDPAELPFLSNAFLELPREQLRVIGYHFTPELWDDLTSAHLRADLFIAQLPGYDPQAGLSDPDRAYLEETVTVLTKASDTLLQLEKGGVGELEAVQPDLHPPD